VKRDNGTFEIAVGNDGPPVPEAEREKIFGRYFQVEARRAAARANRGLGLYFCKLAAEAHGGTIHVEERGELGAVFVVRIPE
jgi:signal transduction histidine kinase